jgi:hypothetical protein
MSLIGEKAAQRWRKEKAHRQHGERHTQRDPNWGGLYKSGGRKKPRWASSAVTTAQLPNTSALMTAVRDWRGELRARHITTKIAMTTAAISATITTPRRTIDMIGPHLALGNVPRCVKVSPRVPLVEMTVVILQDPKKNYCSTAAE